MNKLATIAIGLLFSTLCLAADMTLQVNSSVLSFISTKQDTVAEIHQIKNLSGSISDGIAQVIMDLTSVDTKIDIRDQRMQEHLFETKRFAKATYTTKIDSERLGKLSVGEYIAEPVKGELNLHGQTAPVEANVNITRLKDGGLRVVTLEPVIINANDFDMVNGVNKLRELAGLNSISYAVPVTFAVEFK